MAAGISPTSVCAETAPIRAATVSFATLSAVEAVIINHLARLEVQANHLEANLAELTGKVDRIGTQVEEMKRKVTTLSTRAKEHFHRIGSTHTTASVLPYNRDES